MPATDRHLCVTAGRVTDDNHKILSTIDVTCTVVRNSISFDGVTPYLDCGSNHILDEHVYVSYESGT